MGRLLVFLIVIVAALAGAWFYMPGGKDMLLGAKDKAMSFMPGKADDAATDAVVVEEPVVEEVVVEEPVAEEPAAEEPAAEAAPQN
ncbi:MAG: hypothetical protein AAB227_11165 [Pseudomonadota bacterium]